LFFFLFFFLLASKPLPVSGLSDNTLPPEAKKFLGVSTSSKLSEKVVVPYLKKNKLTTLIRSNEPLLNGYSLRYNKKCVSVNSAPHISSTFSDEGKVEEAKGCILLFNDPLSMKYETKSFCSVSRSF
jgi:hypothetical protein